MGLPHPGQVVRAWGWPHSGQNLAVGLMDAPQFVQNFAPSGSLFPQLGQNIAPSQVVAVGQPPVAAMRNASARSAKAQGLPRLQYGRRKSP